MSPGLAPAHSSGISIHYFRCVTSLPTNHNKTHPIPNASLLKAPSFGRILPIIPRFNPRSRSVSVCVSAGSTKNLPATAPVVLESDSQDTWNVEVGNPIVPASFVPAAKLSLSDQAFFLLAFIACTTAFAFTSLVIAAVPTLYAMRKAAISLAKLADTAHEELPVTMAAIRLSGMEIGDLTLELNDLSQEIADGVNKSAQAVQAAEAGIRQIGVLARQQTISMIQERASLPIISLQPVVAGAAKKTSHAVGQVTKTVMNIISRRDFGQVDNGIDRLEV
ncbi:uncharacterized protein LOC131152965 [Malania oleifera]|uniref:uncharacterized protein LOC131152965 n=1 Tax=Malania oleifera TaxID=397392 RepID=UPI0025AE5263|nr:uncharacterized protein LOC131152965 [Malania oleifera]